MKFFGRLLAVCAVAVLLAGFGHGDQRVSLNARFVAVGDSIVAGSSGPSFMNYALLASGGRFYAPPGANQGTGGNSTAQMVTRTSTWNALNGAVVAIMGGTNDITASVAAATTEANLRTMYNTVEANRGGKPLAITILPRNDAAWTAGLPGFETTRLAINAYIKAQTDITVVDGDAIGFDPSTMTVDGLHPNNNGAAVVGAAVGAAMAGLVNASPILWSSPSDYGNLLTNNDLAGSAGTVTAPCTGVAATGWQLTTNATGLTCVGSVSVVGGYNVQTITIGGTASGAGSVFFKKTGTATISIGETYDLWAGFSTADLVGSPGAFASIAGTQIWLPSAASTNLTQNISGVMRPFAALVTTAAGSSTCQFGIYIAVGAVSGSYSVWAPTWRRVPGGQ